MAQGQFASQQSGKDHGHPADGNELSSDAKIRTAESAAIVRKIISRTSGLSSTIWLLPFWYGILTNSPAIYFTGIGMGIASFAIHIMLCRFYVQSLSNKVLLDTVKRVPSLICHPFALWEKRRRSLTI